VCCGSEIGSLDDLREKRDSLFSEMENIRPDSFVGFKFTDIRRVSFYSVKELDFAISILYERDSSNKIWLKRSLVP